MFLKFSPVTEKESQTKKQLNINHLMSDNKQLTAFRLVSLC